ncbi:hypothetical protein KKA53_01325 [Candidatus Dependentiae bacterium]|nr:hypothetical protein [Candidatus Dependentiae bacterium]
MVTITKTLLVRLLVFTSVLIANFSVHAQDLESKISSNVKKTIERQLLDGVKIQEKISNCVSKEIDSQVFAKLHGHAKREAYDADSSLYNVHNVSVPFVYKVPRWPVQSLFFLKKDLVGVSFNFSWATQAYSSSGGTRDVSDLIFQEEPFCVKDVLLASKLIDKGYAQPTTKYKFLEILKDQLLYFDASVERQEVAFSYIRHFLRGDIALGLQIPIVRKKRNLTFISEISAANRTRLESENPDFFTLFPNGLVDFFKDILAQKQMSFSECDSCGSYDTEVGLGDVELFVNYEIMWKSCKRFFVGLHALLHTSKQRDVYKLWDPELGNGGFTELGAFGSILFSNGRWFNPHLFAQVTYSIPAKVFRRVPRLRRTEDVTANAAQKYGNDFTPYGNYIQYSGSVPEFCEHDATVRRFSDTAKKTKLRNGNELFARVGNMFERVFHERMFFDFFYDFFLKGKSYLGYRRPDCLYDPSILKKNSYKVAHRVGANISCQFDNSWRASLGGLYTFAGRNTLKAYEIEGSVTLEF